MVLPSSVSRSCELLSFSQHEGTAGTASEIYLSVPLSNQASFDPETNVPKDI